MIDTYLRSKLLYIYGKIKIASYYYFNIIICPQVYKNIVEVKTNNSAWDCLFLTYVKLQQQPWSDKSRAVCVCMLSDVSVFAGRARQTGGDKETNIQGGSEGGNKGGIHIRRQFVAIHLLIDPWVAVAKSCFFWRGCGISASDGVDGCTQHVVRYWARSGLWDGL